jgi:ketosteroid isomerase-like protein
VIARIWRGVVSAGDTAEYARYVRDTGVAEYARTPGNRGAEILTRDRGDGTAEILAVSMWDGWDDIRRFAGDDVDAMVLYPEDERYLVGESQLSHYDVVAVDARTPDVRAVAEAFSGHRFAEAYAFLAPDVTWNIVGGESRQGRDAVMAVCAETLTELSDTTTEFTRFVTVSDGDRAAVDTVARYTGPDGTTTVVSSCDVYEFRDGALTTITSYYAELPAVPVPRS